MNRNLNLISEEYKYFTVAPSPYPPVALPCPGGSSLTPAGSSNSGGSPVNPPHYSSAHYSSSYSHYPALNHSGVQTSSYAFSLNYNHSPGSYPHGVASAAAAAGHFSGPPPSFALELTRRRSAASRSPLWPSAASWDIEGRVGNPSPPQQLSSERAVSEGRAVGLGDHIHHSGDHYSHGFSHGILPHSGWSTQELTGGSGPISGGVGTGSASSLASSSSNEGMSGCSSVQQPASDVFNSSEKYVKYNRLNEADANADNRFQYVLAAATSIATKLNEESLTYLNQGQPYEIKMKKLGDLSNFRGKVLRSVVRLCFHERRLQYMEREQIEAWRLSRPGDRIVEIDVPLSYGIYDVIQDPANLNIVEFVWDPTKEVGVYIKVNCISTEFTPKKHGGEKGVPFRIQVETYSHGDLDGTAKRLHVAGCQIKVFKLKGADRKHKQDREKIFKRPVSEQEKYQPSCECTILAEIPLDLVHTTAIVPVGSVAAAAAAASSSVAAAAVVAGSAATTTAATTTAARNYNSPAQLRKSQSFTSEGCPSESPLGHETDNVESPTSMTGSSSYQYYMQPLSAEASAQQTFQWLQANRFSAVARNFAHFSGADILRLTKNDLIQICGVADGIRLFNALHAKTIVPRLTLYLTQDQTNIFHAVYMENLGCMELVQKISSVLQLQLHQVADVYMEGPGGIHVLVTDEVIHNTKDESMFAVEILRDQNTERYRLLLKPTAPR
nr:EOG090X0AJ3 [Eulimnadia texana]